MDIRAHASRDGTALERGSEMAAESAGLAALSSLATFGPATAHELLSRVETAARVAGETILPFKHAVLYAVLHELAFEQWVSIAHTRFGNRAVYSITPEGRSHLNGRLERWRTAHLVIRASGASRDPRSETVRP